MYARSYSTGVPIFRKKWEENLRVTRRIFSPEVPAEGKQRGSSAAAGERECGKRENGEMSGRVSNFSPFFSFSLSFFSFDRGKDRVES